ncbi:hypothetical protein FQN54_005075 [Arachnomyces sp. PD_36]|nr:hypothetical protein FQN54_005075 [Arachnomyces sp. PD_36]
MALRLRSPCAGFILFLIHCPDLTQFRPNSGCGYCTLLGYDDCQETPEFLDDVGLAIVGGVMNLPRGIDPGRDIHVWGWVFQDSFYRYRMARRSAPLHDPIDEQYISDDETITMGDAHGNIVTPYDPRAITRPIPQLIVPDASGDVVMPGDSDSNRPGGNPGIIVVMPNPGAVAVPNPGAVAVPNPGHFAVPNPGAVAVPDDNNGEEQDVENHDVDPDPEGGNYGNEGEPETQDDAEGDDTGSGGDDDDDDDDDDGDESQVEDGDVDDDSGDDNDGGEDSEAGDDVGGNDPGDDTDDNEEESQFEDDDLDDDPGDDNDDNGEEPETQDEPGGNDPGNDNDHGQGDLEVEDDAGGNDPGDDNDHDQGDLEVEDDAGGDDLGDDNDGNGGESQVETDEEDHDSTGDYQIPSRKRKKDDSDDGSNGKGIKHQRLTAGGVYSGTRSRTRGLVSATSPYRFH